MTTKQKIIVSVSSLLALALVAYLVLLIYTKVLEKKSENSNTKDSGNSNRSDSSSSSAVSDVGRLPIWPLKYGSGIRPSVNMSTTKTYVRSIQRACNYYGAGIVVDGQWGANTESAVNNLRELVLMRTERDVVQPFKAHIRQVSTALYPDSKWEITKDSCDAIAKWINVNAKNYKTFAEFYKQ